MEQIQNKEEAPTIKGEKTINIEDTDFIYEISKTENEEGITIKLSGENPDKRITFIYQAKTEKIVKDIKALIICDNIEEIITSLQEIFNTGKIEVIKEEEKYVMKIEVSAFGKVSKYQLLLEKTEELIDEKESLKKKISELEYKYNEIKKELNVLRNTISLNKEKKDEKDLKDKIIEILKDDKDIKDILLKEFQEKMLNTYIKKFDDELNKKIDIKFENKVDTKTFKENMNKIKSDNNNQIEEIKKIKNIIENKNKDNYITLKMEIKKDDINKNRVIMNQCSTYKSFKNFELEDVEVYINEEHIPLKFRHYTYDNSHFCEYNEKSNDINESKEIYKKLNNNYLFFWNFPKEGIYNIKIIFKKNYVHVLVYFMNAKISQKLIFPNLIVVMYYHVLKCLVVVEM